MKTGAVESVRAVAAPQQYILWGMLFLAASERVLRPSVLS